jgi:hypothetical protein
MTVNSLLRFKAELWLPTDSNPLINMYYGNDSDGLRNRVKPKYAEGSGLSGALFEWISGVMPDVQHFSTSRINVSGIFALFAT